MTTLQNALCRQISYFRYLHGKHSIASMLDPALAEEADKGYCGVGRRLALLKASHCDENSSWNFSEFDSALKSKQLKCKHSVFFIRFATERGNVFHRAFCNPLFGRYYFGALFCNKNKALNRCR